MNFNKVILAGNLTRDPQLSYTPAQTPVVDFGMAINRNWTGQDGQKREETCFVDCRAFASTAETINQYLSKGKPILLEGKLHFSSWEKDGQKHSKLRVTVDHFQFVPDGEKRQAAPAPVPAPSPAPSPAPAPAPAPAPQQQAPPAPEPEYPPFGSDEDDGSVPF